MMGEYAYSAQHTDRKRHKRAAMSAMPTLIDCVMGVRKTEPTSHYQQPADSPGGDFSRLSYSYL